MDSWILFVKFWKLLNLYVFGFYIGCHIDWWNQLFWYVHCSVQFIFWVNIELILKLYNYSNDIHFVRCELYAILSGSKKIGVYSLSDGDTINICKVVCILPTPAVGFWTEKTQLWHKNLRDSIDSTIFNRFLWKRLMAQGIQKLFKD